MLDFEKFDWGEVSQKDKGVMLNECLNRIYEKYFNVEENDIVVDIGGYTGDFTYSILDRNPEHCWIIEPVEDFFRTMYKNLKNYPVSFVRGAISDEVELEMTYADFGSRVPGVNFKKFVENNCIDRIDFLKVDCEGGEYLIFTDENVYFLKNNVKKIACEIHLSDDDLKRKFRYFRDNILVKFDNYQINSVDGIDIKWDLFNEHFITYYNEILIYIDNRN
jgi:FkbM family methyltransferase